MMLILELLGGLGVFLFGMRIMSNGLQKVAGSRLRELLALCTTNRMTGIASGFLMTCSVQSSSATTVMIVSFANAGLLTLTQAIGPIMGANSGTTITGWLVSILGFKVKKTARFKIGVLELPRPVFLGGEAAAPRAWDPDTGGTLYLNVGDRKGQRNIATDDNDEPFVIEQLGGAGGKALIKVTAFGRSNIFDNVTDIDRTGFVEPSGICFQAALERVTIPNPQ